MGQPHPARDDGDREYSGGGQSYLIDGGGEYFCTDASGGSSKLVGTVDEAGQGEDQEVVGCDKKAPVLFS